MTEHTYNSDSDSDSMSAHELRVHYLHSQMRLENKELKEHVERLKALLNYGQEFQEEKRVLLEALHGSCARQKAAKERLKDEEEENECLHDALADLRYILKCAKSRRLQLQALKRVVFTGKCFVEEAQYALAERDEIIRRKNAEIEELLALFEDCWLHADETAKRVQDAEKAAQQRELLRVREREREACKVERKKTPPPPPVETVHRGVRQSRMQGTLFAFCSFIFTLLVLFFLISCVIPAFSHAESPGNSCIEVILDTVKELIVPFSNVHHTELPLR